MDLNTTVQINAEALFRHVKIVGFRGPDEELIRAAVSRVPPELLANCIMIKSDPTMGAKHGRFVPKTKTILMNPTQFGLRQRFGRGPGWIWHFELTMVHEVGHSVFEGLPQGIQEAWNNLSSWTKGDAPADYVRYVEKRPGWEIGKTEKWAHRPGVAFTRHYAERNPGEDFADSFAFFIMGKPHQMGKDKREFMANLVNSLVHTYPKATIEGPSRAYGERGN